MFKYNWCQSAAGLFVLLASGVAWTVEYELAEGFPEAAAGAYGIEIDALGDGRLVVWNGETVYVQSLPGGNRFVAVGTGYVGDPGFMAVSPDGHTLLLGAGYSGKLYWFDADNPSDYTPESVAATAGHYSGVFLTETLVLLDKTADDFSTCELAIIDLSSPAPAAKTVMRKPSAGDVPAGGFAASAQLAVNSGRTTVYAMSVVYDEMYTVVASQLKSISASALIGAYNADETLDWDTDAAAIGEPMEYNSGGPAGVMGDGTVVIGGFGGIQLLDASTGAIEETLMPAGFDYYGVACNTHTGDIYAIVADPLDWSMDVVYAPLGALTPLPGLSIAGLVVLTGALAAAGVIGRRRA